MSYYLRALYGKQKHPRWKVQFVCYHDKEFNRRSRAKKPRKEWDVPQERWSVLGIRSYMTFEQARIRVRQINAQAELKRQEERTKKIHQKLALEELKFKAALPEAYKEEFEVRYLHVRFSDKRRQKTVMTQWRATQRMLMEIQLDPLDWHDEAHRFYDYFHKKKISLSYIRKVLYLTNLWEFFLARKLGQPYLKVPMPTGLERNRLLQAYFLKSGVRKRCQSDPISPEQLKRAKRKMKLQDYRWVYLSVWLGLRPQEIDQLKDRKLYRVQEVKNSVPILWVYQTKLLSVPPRYRWKLIPLIFREQRKTVGIIREQDFKRPLVKTVRRYFGRYTTLYGGRKGFTDLMMAHDQQLVDISQWMGHSSIERTWKNYKSRPITHYTPVLPE